MYTMSQITLGILLIIFFFTQKVFAISNQLCANCHTMHASYFEGGTHYVITPNPTLLKTNCIGCHQGTTGYKNSFGAPIVYHTTNPGQTGPGSTLAGGDFYWMSSGNFTTGHNVKELVPSSPITPPGWDPSATSGYIYGQIANGETSWSRQLTCAGTYGCHGYHNNLDPLIAIKGSHHKNMGGSNTTADSNSIAQHPVGGAYRFLAGIYGKEDIDWEYTASSSDHNEYYGINGNSNYSNKNTISFLCAKCHGYFHSQMDDATTGSPFLRHPTDYMIPNSWEYSNYTTYNLSVPVARNSVYTAPSSTVTPGSGNAIVMCLSCHRAHGSEFAYILRWDYRGWPGNGKTIGCSICHSTKY